MKDLTGYSKGQLVVIAKGREERHTTAKGRKILNRYWLCRCSCGTEKEVAEKHLLYSDIKSCGCYMQSEVYSELSSKRIKASKHFEDLSGKTYNRLTVLGFDKVYKGNAYYLCQCLCGKTISVKYTSLVNNKVRSCGCLQRDKAKSNYVDLTGQRFNHLVCLSYLGKSKWKCQCDCGNLTIVDARHLKNGHTKSCGCWNKEVIDKKTNKLKGLRFGKLIVLDKAEKKGFWECKCDCGNRVVVKGANLTRTRNPQITCGCADYYGSETKSLAKQFNRSTSTIVFTEHRLFGEALVKPSKAQIKELKNYFSQTEMQGSSFEEKEVVSFVKSIYKGEVIENDRSLIAPKELDIYIPEKNFAIEYDGLAWHSERTGCKSSYHLQKTRACNGKGVRLFHLYSNEWRDKKEIVKSMISSALGIYERKIYARKCDVREVTDRTAVKDMLNGNHLQGDCGRFSKAMGLYYKGELVQLCVFGTQHFGRKDTVELYRMVTLKNTQVVGGFSRLMEHSGYSEVMSYVSLRTFNASGYYSSGWTLESISQPSYCYTDGFATYSRQLFKKDKCLKRFDNVTEDMTETEMTEKNGFYKLWDCGTYKVSWKKELKNKCI